LFGSGFRVGAARGTVLDLDGTPVIPTVHPSSVLRASDADERATTRAGLVADLRLADEIARRAGA
jgi:DNA polymerase